MFKSFLFFSFSLILLISGSTFLNKNLQKKIIRSGDYNIECYVSLKEKKVFNDHKVYYWFKSGEIHTSMASVGGKVLHSKYSKFYRSNQLAEQGAFDYGLKNGLWKNWREDGTLKEIVEWKRGLLDGEFTSFDSFGNPLEKGNYKRNLKTGTWVNLKTKDTITYDKGTLLTKEKEGKKSFLKRLFKKKKNKV